MAEQKKDKPRKKLTITEIGDVITSGEGKNGAWQLRKLKALDAAGQPINEQLKTFGDLAPLVGKLEEFFVERDEREHNGTTYVSFLVSPTTSRLEMRVIALEERLAQLEDRLGGGEAPASNPAVGAQGPAGGSSPATSDDDIPF